MGDRLQVTRGEALEVLERDIDALVVIATWAPSGSPPPAHHHPAQDERFEVLKGALRAKVGGVVHDLRAGDTLEIPRGSSHQMSNPHPEPARARWETRPAGRTEAWFRAVASLQGTEHVNADGVPKPLPFAALAQRYRDTFRLDVGPGPVGSLAVRVLSLIAAVTGRVPDGAR